MTDERRPDEPAAPDPWARDPQAPDPRATPDQPINEPSSEPPPPLAPLVEGGQAAGDDSSDTTVQPTSSWEQQASTPPPPPIAPPAVPPPAPQPAVSWAPAPAEAAAVPAGRRTALSMAAGILLILAGILGGLFGLAITVFGSAIVRSIRDLGPFPEMEGVDAETFISGFVAFFGIIIIVYSLVYLIAGIGVLRSRDWGRILGIIVGILSGLVWLGGFGGANQPGAGDATVSSLVGLAIHVYIVVALLFFWRTKPATA